MNISLRQGMTWLQLAALAVLQLMLCAEPAAAQSQKKKAVEPGYAWKLIEPLGLREPAPLDTLPLNYYRHVVPSAVSDAWATTGNYGAEGENLIFSQRQPRGDFFLNDAMRQWLPSVDKARFYNTRIPMTLLGYTSAGGRENSQENLKATFSGNINRQAQVGGMLDYIYSKGSYANQALKNLTWGLSGSYIGDRYEFQGFFNHYNALNKENGGITDVLYITDPAVVQGGITKVDPKTIPTRLSDAHTKLTGSELYLNNRYKVGYWHEEQIDDTTTQRTYIPVSSFIYTFQYRAAKHLFLEDSAAPDDFFENNYFSAGSTRDETSFSSVINTLGVSLLEGFHRYAKFGIAAYITHSFDSYTQTPDTINRENPLPDMLTPLPEGFGIDSKSNRQRAWVGAQITKQRGQILTYEATARIGILGDAAGDFNAAGEVRTRIPLFGDTVSVGAFGSFDNIEAPYLLKNYRSNHFVWQNDFGKERTVKFGGSIQIPRTGTKLQVGVTNLQNYIYFGSDFLPHQHSSNVQVLGIGLEQKLHVGILNWDNSIHYQTTSDDVVVSLPALTVYSNLYLKFRVATLHVQLGVDCDYYTKYYGLAYQPATATFANQRTVELGNYPLMNVYANLKLSKTRFFIMMSHFNQGLFGGDNYFGAVDYPLNPRRFQIGLSIDFAN